MSIIKNEQLNFIKLNYVLFNKFDDPVLFRIYHNINGTIYMKNEGEIFSDGTYEMWNNMAPDIIQYHHDFSYNVSENHTYNFKYDTYVTRECISCGNTFEDKINNTSTIITRTTRISAKDIKSTNNTKIIVIYPNNILPPLIRVYNLNTDIDILKFDDKLALYNTYYENIDAKYDAKTITIDSHPVQSNIPFLKMEDDRQFQKHLSSLSNESLDNDGCYCNNTYWIKIANTGDISYLYDQNTEYAYSDFVEDSSISDDSVFNIVSELYDLDINDLSKGKWYKNNGCKHFYLDNTLDAYIFNDNNIMICGRFKISSKKSTNELEIHVIDLEDGKVIMNSAIQNSTIFYYDQIANTSVFTGFNNKCFDKILSSDNTNLLNCIRDIHNAISNSKISDIFSYVYDSNYFVISGSKISSFNVYKLLSGKDEKGNYVYLRGIFGNLIKVYE